MMSGAGSDEEIWGSKPIVPELGESQQTAINANIAALPSIQELGAGVNTFNQEQLLTMLRKAIPGYDDIVKKAGENLNAGLRGEIPQDVADAIKRNAAVKSLYGGFGGSGMADSLQARDLGLTSLQITDRALGSAAQWMNAQKAIAVPGLFDVSSMFITPQQQFERDFAKAKIDAAPDPTARGIFDSEMSWIGMILSIYGGGAGYTGTYRPNYSENLDRGSGDGGWGDDNGGSSYQGGWDYSADYNSQNYDSPGGSYDYENDLVERYSNAA